jgi:hypothetical protein
MGHSVHNVDIRKLLSHTTPYTLYHQLKLGFIREEHTLPACQWPSKEIKGKFWHKLTLLNELFYSSLK